MKKKIVIDVPSLEQLLAGLDPRALHAPLPKAERAVVDAEQLVERRRRELAVAERTAVELPARVNRGESAPSALADALRARDAAVLLLEQSHLVVAAAHAQVLDEDVNAKAAVVREIDRRSGPIKRQADELAPVIDEFETLEGNLGLARDRAQLAVNMARSVAQDARYAAQAQLAARTARTETSSEDGAWISPLGNSRSLLP